MAATAPLLIDGPAKKKRKKKKKKTPVLTCYFWICRCFGGVGSKTSGTLGSGVPGFELQGG